MADDATASPAAADTDAARTAEESVVRFLQDQAAVTGGEHGIRAEIDQGETDRAQLLSDARDRLPEHLRDDAGTVERLRGFTARRLRTALAPFELPEESDGSFAVTSDLVAVGVLA